MNVIYLGTAIISELMDKITTTADIYLKKKCEKPIMEIPKSLKI